MMAPPQKSGVVNKYYDPKRGKEALASYIAALCHPFCSKARGATVPSKFRTRTVGYCLETVIPIVTDSGGSFRAIFYNDPIMFCSLLAGSFASGTSCVFQYTGATSVYGITTPGDLSSIFTDYRIVGCGYKLDNIQAVVNVQGKAMVARVAQRARTFGYNVLNSITPNASTTVMSTQVGFSNVDGSMLKLPDSAEISMAKLIEGSWVLAGSPISQNAFNFRDASNQSVYGGGGTPYVIGDIPTYVTSGGVTTIPNPMISDSPSANFGGWDALLMYFEGCTASTTVAELKVIFHFEGTPYNGTGITGVPVPAAPEAAHVPAQWVDAVMAAQTSKGFDEESLYEDPDAESVSSHGSSTSSVAETIRSVVSTARGVTEAVRGAVTVGSEIAALMAMF